MKRKYNIVATIKQNGDDSRKICPIGEVTEDELLDIVLAYYIIDYSNALIKTLEKEGYHLEAIKDGLYRHGRCAVIGKAFSVAQKMHNDMMAATSWSIRKVRQANAYQTSTIDCRKSFGKYLTRQNQ